MYDMKPRQIAPIARVRVLRPEFVVQPKPKRSVPMCVCGNPAASDSFCRKCRPKSKPRPARKKALRLLKQGKQAGYTKEQRKALWRPYSERNVVLVKLGFQGYREYLKSPLWFRIRKQVLTDSTQCVKCNGAATQVHHSRYTHNNLAGISIQYLHSVCGQCHQTAEVRPDGSKATLEKANAFLLGNGIRGDRT